MFGMLFNKNKKEWLAQLGESDNTEQWKYTIVNFFIKDNISFVQYIENHKFNNIVLQYNSMEYFQQLQSLSIEEKFRNIKLSPSKSLKKHFNDLDRPMLMPNWFIIGYPDVAAYLCDGDPSIKEEMRVHEKEFSDSYGNPNFKLWRWSIDKYKSIFGSLELQL